MKTLSKKSSPNLINFHIVSIKPGESISTGKSYEAKDLTDAYELWKKDGHEDSELLVAYSNTILNMPLLIAPEIEAVEFKDNQRTEVFELE